MAPGLHLGLSMRIQHVPKGSVGAREFRPGAPRSHVPRLPHSPPRARDAAVGGDASPRARPPVGGESRGRGTGEAPQRARDRKAAARRGGPAPRRAPRSRKRAHAASRLSWISRRSSGGPPARRARSSSAADSRPRPSGAREGCFADGFVDELDTAARETLLAAARWASPGEARLKTASGQRLCLARVPRAARRRGGPAEMLFKTRSRPNAGWGRSSRAGRSRRTADPSKERRAGTHLTVTASLPQVAP